MRAQAGDRRGPSMSGPERAAWVTLAALSLGVAAYAFAHVAAGFATVPSPVAANHQPAALWTHIAASAAALALGPLQFLPGLRRSRPGLHRWAGRVYVAACLAGGLAGAAAALATANGPVAAAGFFMLALAWVGATGLALRAALKRDFASHERWMVRSFALTLAAVTLRLDLLVILLPGMSFEAVYPVAAWACWIPNLAAAELWLRTRRRGLPQAPATA